METFMDNPLINIMDKLRNVYCGDIDFKQKWLKSGPLIRTPTIIFLHQDLWLPNDTE